MMKRALFHLQPVRLSFEGSSGDLSYVPAVCRPAMPARIVAGREKHLSRQPLAPVPLPTRRPAVIAGDKRKSPASSSPEVPMEQARLPSSARPSQAPERTTKRKRFDVPVANNR